jgi:hypothetical protein
MIPAAQVGSEGEFNAKKAAEEYIGCLNKKVVDLEGLSKLMYRGPYNGREKGIFENVRHKLPGIKFEFETELNESETQVSLWFKRQNKEEGYSCFLTVLIVIGQRARRRKNPVTLLWSFR